MTDKAREVLIIGGGPAGSAAALGALAEGAPVTIQERSRFPRHKVCGEFLSPEVAEVMESLGMKDAFLAAGPARLRVAVLHIGGRRKRFRLPEAAYSLSRYSLDHLLLQAAIGRGAEVRTEAAHSPAHHAGATVMAHGRQTPARRGERLFGFKAHFRGPVDDAVEMFFFDGCYVGVSPVEGGAVNICGLAPESALAAAGFDPTRLFRPNLRDHIRRLDRTFDWMLTGPLVFRDNFRNHADAYLTGDAMGFVDPFTGSGILAALVTGRMAGRDAARGVAVAEYNAACRRTLRRQYSVASLLRGILGAGLAESVARWIPGRVLYGLTRPSL